MTSHQSNLEARRAALNAVADSATRSAESLLQIAKELPAQADKLGPPARFLRGSFPDLDALRISELRPCPSDRKFSMFPKGNT